VHNELIAQPHRVAVTLDALEARELGRRGLVEIADQALKELVGAESARANPRAVAPVKKRSVSVGHPEDLAAVHAVGELGR
jgi:hypothetical protein